MYKALTAIICMSILFVGGGFAQEDRTGGSSADQGTSSLELTTDTVSTQSLTSGPTRIRGRTGEDALWGSTPGVPRQTSSAIITTPITSTSWLTNADTTTSATTTRTHVTVIENSSSTSESEEEVRDNDDAYINAHIHSGDEPYTYETVPYGSVYVDFKDVVRARNMQDTFRKVTFMPETGAGITEPLPGMLPATGVKERNALYLLLSLFGMLGLTRIAGTARKRS